MDIVGVLIEKYEDEHVPELADGYQSMPSEQKLLSS
jgi:hypothetical protein